MFGSKKQTYKIFYGKTKIKKNLEKQLPFRKFDVENFDTPSELTHISKTLICFKNVHKSFSKDVSIFFQKEHRLVLLSSLFASSLFSFLLP